MTRVPSGEINFELYGVVLDSWKREVGASDFNTLFMDVNTKHPDIFRSFENYRLKLEILEKAVRDYLEYKKQLSKNMTEDVKDNEDIVDMFGNTVSYYKGEG